MHSKLQAYTDRLKHHRRDQEEQAYPVERLHPPWTQFTNQINGATHSQNQYVKTALQMLEKADNIRLNVRLYL
jgi:hypothetical protein